MTDTPSTDITPRSFDALAEVWRDQAETYPPHAAGDAARAAVDLCATELEAVMASFPEIVCLCGSTRFEDAFKQAQFDLTVEGKIVLTVAGNWKDDHDDVWDEIDAEQKEALDALHFRKIDLADRVHVLNVDGYVGSSTRNEIGHAVETGTEVTWLEPENKPGWFGE